jgi:beta-1,4-mannosyl-glycoprotein beta-1,4-N-acetylglucosaminyltransferase
VKVFDCFTFFNELDLLEIRLNELVNVVDAFILVEARETFTGNPKPLYFWENRERFEKFNIYSLYLNHLEGGDAWSREAYQRNAIADGLRSANAQPLDIALIGDVDEIPFVGSVRSKARAALTTQQSWTMAHCMYYANNQCANFLWQGTQAVRVAEAVRQSPEGVRQTRQWQPIGEIDGIHLSSMVGERGAEAVREKLTSFSHTECARPEFLTDENLNNAIQKRIDPCGNNAWQEWQITNLNYPKYLRDNLDRYPYLVKE